MGANNRARCLRFREFFNKLRFRFSAKLSIVLSNLRVGVKLKAKQPMGR